MQKAQKARHCFSVFVCRSRSILPVISSSTLPHFLLGFLQTFPGSGKNKSRGPVAPGPVVAVKAKPMPSTPPGPSPPLTPPPTFASGLPSLSSSCFLIAYVF